MRELAAAGALLRVPVAVACRVLKLHRQHYYAWLAQPVTGGELEEAYLANAVFDAHREDPEAAYDEAVGVLCDVGLVRRDSGGLLVHAAAARYAPRPELIAAGPSGERSLFEEDD